MLLSLRALHPQPARLPWMGCRAPAISLDPSLAFMPSSRLNCYYPQKIFKLSHFSLQTHSALLFQDTNTTHKVPFPSDFPITHLCSIPSCPWKQTHETLEHSSALPLFCEPLRDRRSHQRQPQNTADWPLSRHHSPTTVRHLPAPRSPAPPSAAPSAERTRPEEDAKRSFRDLASTQNYKESILHVHIYPTLFRGLYTRHHVSQRLWIRS